MARTLEEIRADVLELPVGERIDLVRDLVESVDGDPAIEAAHLQEIKRRIALADAGEIGDIDSETLFEELRARYQWEESPGRR